MDTLPLQTGSVLRFVSIGLGLQLFTGDADDGSAVYVLQRAPEGDVGQAGGRRRFRQRSWRGRKVTATGGNHVTPEVIRPSLLLFCFRATGLTGGPSAYPCPTPTATPLKLSPTRPPPPPPNPTPPYPSLHPSLHPPLPASPPPPLPHSLVLADNLFKLCGNTETPVIPHVPLRKPQRREHLPASVDALQKAAGVRFPNLAPLRPPRAGVLPLPPPAPRLLPPLPFPVPRKEQQRWRWET